MSEYYNKDIERIMEKLLLPAKLENLELLICFIKNSAEKQGFSSKNINEIQIAVEEPIVNIISYAYPDKNGNIEITCSDRKGKGLAIEIVDWGVPFDPMSMPEPDIDAPMDDRRIGGLGIYMMRKLMDEVNYERMENQNILTLVKYLHCA
ncbi:MAG: serine/threonine-protein kinase RsbW [Candidatus Poribacteria bacterium]|nr:serine/threonine-protein kinase RsbW [Candidatus Poribacteria bacterium]